MAFLFLILKDGIVGIISIVVWTRMSYDKPQMPLQPQVWLQLVISMVCSLCYSVTKKHHLSIIDYSEYGWLLAEKPRCSKYYSAWSRSFSEWHSRSNRLRSFEKTQVWSLFRSLSQIWYIYPSHYNCFCQYIR